MKKDKEQFEIHPWKIIEKKFKPYDNEVLESIFSLSNEYMGTRGIFEEGFDGSTLPGCYIGGIYLKTEIPYVWKRPGFPSFANSLINTTNWLDQRISVNSEYFSMTDSSYRDYERILDMKTGLLRRKLVFITKDGSETQLIWERFTSHSDRNCAAIRLKIKPLNHSHQIHIKLSLDARLENRDFGTHRIHTSQLSSQADENGFCLLKRVDTSGQYFIHSMAVNTSEFERHNEKYKSQKKLLSYSFSFNAEQGEEYNIDKIVSIWTGRDAGYPWGIIDKDDGTYSIDESKEKEIVEFLNIQSQRHIAKIQKVGYGTLKECHINKFASRWDSIDVEIQGDDLAQQGVRYCIFQLLNVYSGNDSTLNIGPKGYSGENYNGRTFWDSEAYCLPFYLFANPDAAKSLIEYRYNSLDAARKRAEELKYKGAIFPMTTFDGTEDCEVWEYGMMEIHINTTIAYAVYLYEKVVGDKDYIFNHGLEIVLEIARFFASRAKYIPARDEYVINFVCGPDEWRSFVDNNWYTNFMAKWVLEYAKDLSARAKKKSIKDYKRLIKKISFCDTEFLEFTKVAKKIALNLNKELGIYLQDEGTLNLEPFDREELVAGIDLPIDRFWSQEKKFKCSLIKQPDVLLAMFLQRHRFSIEDIKNNYRFYEQRCVHGSSLSPCIHSILASSIGRHNQAYEYYLWASRLDLDNLNFNAHEGLHISSMAGSWLSIIAGFGGMVYSGEKLEFSPVLPAKWNSYSFKINYCQSVLRLSVNNTSVEYQKISGADVAAKMYDEEVTFTNDKKTIALSAGYINRPELKAVVFDLDGVIVDTAKFHYKAWKKVADTEGIYFDESINERLKGVSRIDSLNIILERSEKEYSQTEKEKMVFDKNKMYVKMLEELTEDDILSGIKELLSVLESNKIKISICSASKNACKILKQLNLEGKFDVIVTGDDVTRSKPDRQGIYIAIEKLRIKPSECVVVEDSFSAIAAGVAVGAKTLGIGDKLLLYNSDYVLPSTKFVTIDQLKKLF